jgi:hypothetical protein
LFAKLNKVRSKAGMQEKNKNLLLKFLGSLDTEANRPKGYLVLDNLVDTQEIIVLTLWETKVQMTQFYSPNNPALSNFVKNTQEFMEQPPQRSDYEVVEYKMQPTAESPR